MVAQVVLVVAIVVGIGAHGGVGVEGVGESAGRGGLPRAGGGGGRVLVRSAGEGVPLPYREAILAVVDTPTIGEQVDIGALGAEFAVTLTSQLGLQMEEEGRRTLEKYLQTVSVATLRSWLKGQALPA